MTVEEKLASIGNDVSKDRFPVGMRVLAVDDNHTCLKILENLLRKCQYHVTTTSQAITALNLLRENKNKFDLVISDVDMPDMDGFKLLELVGLEMDLPVIMLSDYSDTKLVMKGITHGACDYLLKPVSIEALKNIWQHVIRRRKFDSKDHHNSDRSDKPHGTDQGPTAIGNADRNGKLNKKRKDQNEDEDEECEENGHENEDPLTQKKPRVVWSVELHRKFVAAVHQLGIDKAVPKRILDMMGVEKLTRENVASHLQKYRLYLKRISCVTNQQANIVAALGGKDSSYLRMSSLDGIGDFHTLAGSGQLPNATVSSFPPAGILGRLNSPAGLGLRGLASSRMMQLGHAQNSNNPINDLDKLQQVLLPRNQNGNLLHGMSTSLELDQLQLNKPISHIGEFTPIDDPTVFHVGSGFPDTGVSIGSSNNSFLDVANNSLMLPGHTQQTQGRRGLGNQSSVRMASLNAEAFEIGFGSSSHSTNHGRCNDNWQSAVPITGFSLNHLPQSHPFNHAELSSGNLRNNFSSIASQIGSSQIDASSTSVLPASLLDSRRDMQCQARPIGNNVQHDNLIFSNLGSFGNRVDQNTKYLPKQRWEDQKQDYNHNSNLSFSSLNSSAPIHGVVDALGQSLGQNNAVCNRNMDVSLISQSNSGDPFFMQHNQVEKSAVDTTEKLQNEYLQEQTKSQGGLIQYNCGSLEDMMNTIIKQEKEYVTEMDEDIDCDVYALGICM